MKFIQEFKAFAMKGNVMDLAVAVVIGAAFGKIVSSLVDNIIMPLVAVITGGLDFTTFSFSIGEAVVAYGVFMQSIIDFVIIAFSIFLVIKQMNRFNKKKAEEPVKEVEPSKEEVLLTEIRDELRRR